MSDTTARPPSRSWRQFGFRTLLGLVTLTCLALLGWRIIIRPYQVQRQVMERLTALGAEYTTQTGGLDWLRMAFGEDHFQDVVEVNVSDCDDPEQYMGDLFQLPRLRGLCVGGIHVGDDELHRMSQLGSLRELVLDSTLVSNEAIERLSGELPALRVARSYHRAVTAIEDRGGQIDMHPQANVQPAWLTVPSPGLAARVYQPSIPRRVDLGGVYFDDELLSYVATLGPLETLHLGYHVDDEGLSSLSRLSNLRHLYLADTFVSDGGLSSLQSFHRLRLLELGRNVSNDGLVHLTSIKSLVYLELTATQVTDAGLTHLHGLPNLAKLGLNERMITDDGLSHLESCRALKELFLADCTDLSDEGFRKLRRFSRLVKLDLQRTNISDAGLQSLRQALPDCNIKP